MSGKTVSHASSVWERVCVSDWGYTGEPGLGILVCFKAIYIYHMDIYLFFNSFLGINLSSSVKLTLSSITQAPSIPRKTKAITWIWPTIMEKTVNGYFWWTTTSSLVGWWNSFFLPSQMSSWALSVSSWKVWNEYCFHLTKLLKNWYYLKNHTHKGNQSMFTDKWSDLQRVTDSNSCSEHYCVHCSAPKR